MVIRVTESVVRVRLLWKLLTNIEQPFIKITDIDSYC